MIQGFPSSASTLPGQAITLHVSTDAPQFRIDFYRQGPSLEFQFRSDIFAGVFAPDHNQNDDWTLDWPRYDVALSDDTAPGAYIAMFVECDQNGVASPTQQPPLNVANSYAAIGKAFFVVRNPYPGYNTQLLYKIPLFTYHAYNVTGGASVYQGQPVSLLRPGGGSGGIPWDGATGTASYVFAPPYGDWDPFDNYDLDPINLSPRQVFEHWDAKFISFLESNGYRTDYCTDMDVHQDSDLSLLKNYSVLLSVGHDEYYSVPMRNNIEAFRNQGGNVAFLSGNICWWQVLFVDANDTVIAPQSTVAGQGMCNWYQQGDGLPNNAEDSLTGVSFRNAAGRYATGAPTGPLKGDLNGYTVQFTDQWPFERTNLVDGETFGKDWGLVGYECDGTYFLKGNPPFQPALQGGDNTPPNFRILGTCDVSSFSDVVKETPDSGLATQTTGNATATMGFYSQNGTVFTAATTDWPRVVWAGDPSTIQITKNVLDRFGGNPKGFTSLLQMDNTFCLDGFYSGDDNFRHAIVGARDGTITEIFFNPAPGEGIGKVSLFTYDGLIDLGAFYTADDQMRHVLALSGKGALTEIYFNPNTGISATSLPATPEAFRVAGFVSADRFRHAIYATTNGQVIDLRYGNGAPTQTVLASLSGIIDIGSFYSPDDALCHVIVATSDGTITELYYDENYNVSATPIGTIQAPTKVSAYYADDDQFFTRRAQVLAADGRVHEIRYGLHTDRIHVVLIALDQVIDIGGFYSADDQSRHAIVLDTGGNIQELFFNR